LIFY
jgi:hypothetical protein